MEDRNAEVGQATLPTDVAEGGVYLIVTPSVVEPGELPTATVLNNSDETIIISEAYGLIRSAPRPRRDLAKVEDCDFRIGKVLVEPSEESAPQEIAACGMRNLPPGTYAFTKSIQVRSERHHPAHPIPTQFEVRET